MKNTSLIVGAALAGLMSGSIASTAAAASSSPNSNITKAGTAISALADATDKHGCKGQNSCKGNGGCKSGDNGCKGKNSCKGKGGCATDGSKA